MDTTVQRCSLHLVHRAAVTSGDAATGEPWQHYDLGHGYCAYTFFEQFPHRMACARCDFYTPKNSSKAHLLEAKDNLQRMLATVGPKQVLLTFLWVVRR